MLCHKKHLLLFGLVLAILFSITPNLAAKEKILTVQLFGINDWDPALVYSNESRVFDNIYEHLLFYDEGKLIPKLAVSYDKSADGKVWTFKLRKGVKFQNGEPFNADAVKYSIDRTRRINKGPAWIWGPLQEIKVIDQYMVQFICKYAAPVDLLVASQYGSYIIPPKLTAGKKLDWFQKGNAIGTGPYKLVSWEKGVQAVLKKNKDYWGGWKPNQYDTVIFKFVREPSTRIQLIKRNEMQIMEDIPIETVPDLERSPGVVVRFEDSFKNRMYHLHTQKPPTDDINVRKAICYAINYDQLVKKIYGRRATKAIGPLPRTIWGHDPHLKTYEYNVEKAKELLKKSKYAAQLAKGPMKLSMVNYDPDAQATALYIQAALKKIGFDVEIDTTPWPAVWARYKNKEKAPNIGLINWWPTYVTPGDWFKSMWHTEKQPLWNWSYYYNPKFDDIVDEASKLEGSDRNAAIKLYGKAQQMLLDDAVSIFICDLKNMVVKRKEVKGFKGYPAYFGVYFIHDLYY